MKYQMMMRSRPTPAQTIEEKHLQFMQALSEVSTFGLTHRKWPKAPDSGRELSANVNLTRYLQEEFKGYVSYKYRGEYLSEPANDAALYDDYFVLEFNPKKINYDFFALNVFPQYIERFNSYLGFIMNHEFTHIDFDTARTIDFRHGVYRIHPLNFFDEQLCNRAFGLSPEEIQNRLKNKVEKVVLIQNGVLIIVSSEILPLEEEDKINEDLRPLFSSHSDSEGSSNQL